VHTLPNMWKDHLLPLMRGTRSIAPPRMTATRTDSENQQLFTDYHREKDRQVPWLLDKEQESMLDRRTVALGGISEWVRSNVEIIKRGGAMTAHDWLIIICDAGRYVFHDLYADPRQNEALAALLDVTTTIAKATSAYADEEERDLMDKLKFQIISAQVLCESVLPHSEMGPLFHMLQHLPDLVYRWNSVRNFWCFFGER
jgi:hypothetical protein